MVEARLDGDKVALGQRIFPKRIQVRTFLRREADTVAQVMFEAPRQILI